MTHTPHSFVGKCILLTVILASGMAFLDGTVVTIAIPSMQSQLHATITQIQWVINAYALMLASLILISGSLSDHFGRRKIFLWGIGIFTIASFLSSISQNITQLVIFRTLQGIGAAMMIPGSLSIIDITFDEKVRGKAIGLWSGFAGGIAALGPLLGGFLVQTFGWASIFYINIPIGILTFILTLRFIPETKNNQSKGIDFLGAATILISLFGISYAVMQGPIDGWASAPILGSLGGGILAFIIFIIIEVSKKEALVPVHIFRSPLVIGSNIVTFFLYFALNGVIFFLVLNLQQVQHYTPLAAGLSMLPSIIIITFLSGPAGAIADKIGPRVPMILGPLIVSLGMFLLARVEPHAPYVTGYLPGLLLFGFGMAMVIAPLTKSALSVNSQYSGAASGVNNAISRIASLFAIALLGAIFLSLFSSTLTRDIQHSHLTKTQQYIIRNQTSRVMAVSFPKGMDPTQMRELKNDLSHAFMYSFMITMTITALVAFLSAGVAFFTIKHTKKTQTVLS